MLAPRFAALHSTLAISIVLRFLKSWANEMLKEHQNSKASDEDPSCIVRTEKPTEFVIRKSDDCHEKSNSKAHAFLIEAKRSPHSQTEIPKETLRRTQHLTSQLGGARPRRPNRSYFIPSHRFPPTINEDDAACPFRRKLDC
jgi:hypothetical protein